MFRHLLSYSCPSLLTSSFFQAIRPDGFWTKFKAAGIFASDVFMATSGPVEYEQGSVRSLGISAALMT